MKLLLLFNGNYLTDADARFLTFFIECFRRKSEEAYPPVDQPQEIEIGRVFVEEPDWNDRDFHRMYYVQYAGLPLPVPDTHVLQAEVRDGSRGEKTPQGDHCGYVQVFRAPP